MPVHPVEHDVQACRFNFCSSKFLSRNRAENGPGWAISLSDPAQKYFFKNVGSGLGLKFFEKSKINMSLIGLTLYIAFFIICAMITGSFLAGPSTVSP